MTPVRKALPDAGIASVEATIRAGGFSQILGVITQQVASGNLDLGEAFNRRSLEVIKALASDSKVLGDNLDGLKDRAGATNAAFEVMATTLSESSMPASALSTLVCLISMPSVPKPAI